MYDGITTGAPAFRQAQQQVLHLFSSVAEVVQNYFPTNCALDKIVNATIEACDPLDGRTDGVISRSDLCKINFNLTSIIGQSYACAAETSSSLGFGFGKRQVAGSTTTSTPAQNGTINEQDIAIAQTIYDGLFTSGGKRAYLSFQIGAEFEDAVTEYDDTTGTYTYEIPSTGGVYVAKFVEQIDEDNLTTLENVDYDTSNGWKRDSQDSTTPCKPPCQIFPLSETAVLSFSIITANPIHQSQLVLPSTTMTLSVLPFTQTSDTTNLSPSWMTSTVSSPSQELLTVPPTLFNQVHTPMMFSLL